MTQREGVELPICTGCGGILGYGLEGGCICNPTHAKTGKSVRYVPITAIEEERERGRRGESIEDSDAPRSTDRYLPWTERYHQLHIALRKANEEADRARELQGSAAARMQEAQMRQLELSARVEALEAVLRTFLDLIEPSLWGESELTPEDRDTALNAAHAALTSEGER
jgi:hypothetical protein